MPVADKTKFLTVAGLALVDSMNAEIEARCRKPDGEFYASEDLCKVQREHSGRGILGAEIVKSMYGWSVRYDSGLQEWGLLAGARSRTLDGTLEHAERWATAWVAADPARRYAWRRV